jgi:hypothetical protein
MEMTLSISMEMTLPISMEMTLSPYFYPPQSLFGSPKDQNRLRLRARTVPHTHIDDKFPNAIFPFFFSYTTQYKECLADFLELFFIQKSDFNVFLTSRQFPAKQTAKNATDCTCLAGYYGIPPAPCVACPANSVRASLVICTYG